MAVGRDFSRASAPERWRERINAAKKVRRLADTFGESGLRIGGLRRRVSAAGAPESPHVVAFGAG